MLRVATIEDFDIVKSMATKFLEASGYKEYSDDETIDNLIKGLLEGNKNEAIIIIYDDKGMIAGSIVPFPFNNNKWVATEVAWWVEPEDRSSGIGKELLDAFEYWVKEKTKATTITMGSLDEKLGNFYTREGYKLYERAYVKQI